MTPVAHSAPADDARLRPLDGLALLRSEFRRRGWSDKATGRVIGELSSRATVALSGIVLMYWQPAWWSFLVGLALATAGSLGVATNTHSSSHYASSDRRWVNELLTYLGYPFFLMLSATYWHRKHVVIHHTNPNVVGVDDDIDLMPWFALTREEFERASGFRRVYYRCQWILLPLAIAVTGFQMHVAGWRHVIRTLADPTVRRTAHWIDLGCMVLHLIVWIALPAYLLDPVIAIEVYVARIVLMGFGLFAVLAPAHLPHEACFLRREAMAADFVLRQTATTVNYRSGVVARFVCSGLQYQIEHHLFPSMSHVHYPAIQPMVERFCERHGYPYRVLSWPVAVWRSLQAFWMVRDVGTLRRAD